jgi:hypothetical protein
MPACKLLSSNLAIAEEAKRDAETASLISIKSTQRFRSKAHSQFKGRKFPCGLPGALKFIGDVQNQLRRKTQ